MSDHDDGLPRASFTTFEESTAEDWAKIVPQLSTTQSLVADRVIGLLRDYVFCALIHDIGDTLSPFNHPDIAAAIVKPFVSEANHFMVQNHGVFQGYYFWDYIGMDGNARDQFRDSPHFDYTEEFTRLYDQTAFDATYTSNPLEHYEPLIRQFLKADG